MDRSGHQRRSELEAFPCTERGTTDSTVWNMLPSHLVDIILALLPFESLCCLSRVCKVWNRRVRSRNCMEVWADAPGRAPWLLFFTRSAFPRDYISTYSTKLEKRQLGTTCEPKHARIFDSELNKWYNLPLCPPINVHAFFTTGTSLASGGGLVCYFSYENKSQSIVVSNPLTKSCRRLPPLLGKPRTMTMLGLVIDRVSSTYKVVVAGYFRSGGRTFQNKAEVYDSRTETWTSTGNIPVNGTGDQIVYFGKPVFSRGFLYAWNSARKNLVLLSCDLDRGVWNELRAPLPESLRFEELLEWQGRILMVGTRFGTRWSPCIWELQARSSRWIEVDQMPQELFDVCFDDSSGKAVSIVPCQAGQFVYLFFHSLLDYSGRCKWVVYDLSNRTWQRPRNVSQADVFGKKRGQTARIFNNRRVFREGIFYEPRLDVMP